MNTKLRIETKIDFQKHFLKVLKNAAFGKTIEDVIKDRDKLVITNKI